MSIMDQSSINEDDLNAAADTLLGQDPDPQPEPQPAPEPEQPQIGEPDEGPIPEGDEPDPNAFDPSSIDVSMYQAYQDFANYVGSNPEFASYVANYPGFNPPDPNQVSATGQGQVAGAPTPTQPAPDQFTLPADIDPDDPAIKALLPLIQQQNEQLLSLRQQAEVNQQQFYQERQQQYTAIINRAKASFKDRYELEDKDVDALEQVATRMEVVPRLMAGIDPITGMPSNPDPLHAVDRALEIAYWSTPDYRNRQVAAEASRSQDDLRRKKKLGAISGNSGSAPRTPSAPRNEAERRKMMVEEVAQAMGTGN